MNKYLAAVSSDEEEELRRLKEDAMMRLNGKGEEMVEECAKVI